MYTSIGLDSVVMSFVRLDEKCDCTNKSFLQRVDIKSCQSKLVKLQRGKSLLSRTVIRTTMGIECILSRTDWAVGRSVGVILPVKILLGLKTGFSMILASTTAIKETASLGISVSQTWKVSPYARTQSPSWLSPGLLSSLLEMCRRKWGQNKLRYVVKDDIGK